MVVLVAIIIGIFLWILFNDWQEKRLADARQQESLEWKQQAEVLTRKLTRLEDELQAVKGEAAPAGKAAEIFGPEAQEAPAGSKSPGPDVIERQVMAFFSYLDGRDYIKARQIEGGSYLHYVQAVEDLSANLPKVSGEMESLYGMLKNVSHFFRVLGRKRVQLAAEVLINEREVLESAMRIFYLWYTGPSEKLKGRPSFKALYEYASYLQGTFGGRSYLLRRDSRTRLLTTYYSVLILDQANERNLNPNGMDIRPMIAAAANDMGSHTGLIYQRNYLQELERLARKYQL
jgi:hypothetical protein